MGLKMVSSATRRNNTEPAGHSSIFFDATFAKQMLFLAEGNGPVFAAIRDALTGFSSG